MIVFTIIGVVISVLFCLAVLYASHIKLTQYDWYRAVIDTLRLPWLFMFGLRIKNKRGGELLLKHWESLEVHPLKRPTHKAYIKLLKRELKGNEE